MIGSKSFQWQIRVLSKPLCVLGAAGLILVMGASNGTAATTIVNFDFNEAAGTVMMDNPATAFPTGPPVSDSVSGQTWSPRTAGHEIELEKMQTDGAGSLSADLYDFKSRRDGSLFLGFANAVTDTPGKNKAVMTVVVDPWSFGPVDVKGTDPNTGVPNLWDKEELRIGFGNTSASNTLLFVHLQRENSISFGSDSVTLQGQTAGSNSAANGFDGVETAIAGFTTTDHLTIELTVDVNADLWSIRYGFGTPGSTVLAPLAGNTNLGLNPTRVGNFLRLAFEGDYSDDNFGVDSYTVTQSPEPTSLVLMSLALGLVTTRFRRL